MPVLVGSVMEVGVAEIAAAVRRAKACFDTHADELNAADARLGDGDTGTMLARLTEALAATDLSKAATPGAAFAMLATAGATSTGSSLGTLVVTALMTLSRSTKGIVSIPGAEVPLLLSEVRDAMLARGKVALGDKTVIDGIAAVADADPANAAGAARAVLDRFRELPNRAGRARVYGERSRGLDDPGMLAFALLCEAITAKETAS